MDFKKRFEGRTGHINKKGDINGDQDKATFYMSRPDNKVNDDIASEKRMTMITAANST